MNFIFYHIIILNILIIVHLFKITSHTTENIQRNKFNENSLFYNLSSKCTFSSSGYHCILANKSSNENFCKVYRKNCPNKWRCIDLLDGILCKSNSNINFARQYKFWMDMSMSKEKRSVKTNVHCKIPCPVGTVCDDDRCRCLRHFVGKFCDQEVNYCLNNPCKNNASCIPRLGGFTCNCPPYLAGKYCESYVEQSSYNMKHPNFLFQPFQYIGENYYYIFHSQNLGFRPVAEVNFGDGVIARKNYMSAYLTNAFDTLVNYFNPSLNIESNRLQIYAFKHVYSSPNIYTITVKAFNGYYEVYNTQYEVEVSSIPNCSLEVTLRNAAVNKSSALSFYRKSSINLMSSAWSNCRNVKLKYQWRIYKLKSFEDNLTANNIYQPQNKFKLNNPNLEIPSFTLECGSYAAMLSVEIVKPKPGIKQQIITWFTTMKKPIIAHIQGGKTIWIHTNSTFRVDASMSYDPNYCILNQPPLTFTWKCYPINKFCKGSHLLDETGPVLIIPAGALDENKYTFTVWVNNINNFNITKYAGVASQNVQGVSGIVSFYSIRCLENCLGGYANSMQIIALRGICISNPKYTIDYKKNWIVYPNPDSNTDKGMRLDNTEFYQNDSYIYLYEQQLEAGQQFKFVFSGYNIETVDSNYLNASFAEYYITTYDIPEVGTCSVDPEEGYAMLTSFSVYCRSFVASEKVEESLLYEVTQFNNLEDRAASGALVGYDFTGTIADVTLASGFRNNDYITTLRIAAINNHGLSTYFECNVTVFPLIYFFKEPNYVIQRIQQIGVGFASPLNILYIGGNYLGLVQQIISTSFTLMQFLESNDCKHIDHIILEKAVESVQASFVIYLSKVPISDIKSLKHIATALEKVMGLPSKRNIWKPSIVTSIRILQKLITKLSGITDIYKENLLKDDMDDIGVILISTAARILKFPSPDPEIIREDITDPMQVLKRYSYVEKINPYDIPNKILAKQNTNTILKIIEEYIHIYLKRKIPNERTTLISNRELSVLMKKGAPEFLTTESLSLAERATVTLHFNKSFYSKNEFCNLKMIIMDKHPNWYEAISSTVTNSPAVKIKITNEIDGSPVDADLEIQIRPKQFTSVDILNGSLPITLLWKVKEEHIQIYKIAVPRSGKLLVQFLPIENNYKLQIVIKKNLWPKLSDFWHNGIRIPQKVPKNTRDRGLSVFVDDKIEEEEAYYYLGILPYIVTMKELTTGVDNSNLSDILQNHNDNSYDEKNNEIKQYQFRRTENFFDKRAKIQLVDHSESGSKSKGTYKMLPYSFTAYSVQCLSWNEAIKSWTASCNVKPSTTAACVVCNCTGHNSITATFHRVAVQYQMRTKFNFVISYYENPLIIFVVVYTLILFIGLFKWAMDEDAKDELKRSVCFLVDNYPQCEYCYLVIVYTGRKIKSGTTSNVTIEIEGTNATSYSHVLKNWTQEVLGFGHQDWFVIKTKQSLGEIYCLHIWTDYSGPRPSWYCRRIIIHDVQEQQVWFFNVEKWFDPIHGDGTMSYTVYQTTDSAIFSTADHLKECIIREFDSGIHGWFSIFYKHAYSNYTRKQRVAVAHFHITIMMIILIFLSGVSVSDLPKHQFYKTAWFLWETNDLIMALYTVIIAFPFHNIFVWLFRCIKPAMQWSEATFDENLSRFNLNQTESDTTWINVESKLPTDRREEREVGSKLKKQVSFSSNFFEPEGQRKLYSRYSLEKLSRSAGNDNVVPLRIPLSKPEGAVGESLGSVSAEDLNDPIFGQEVITQSYCFPTALIFIVWALLLILEIICLYIVILYGISFGWIFSLHYVTSLFLAIVFSIIIFEPLKLVCWSFYLFLYNRREYAVEDRSDLVEALNQQFTIPLYMQNLVNEKINKLRESDMYSPLGDKQIRKFKRNRLFSFTSRMIIADLMLLFLFVLLLCVMINEVFDSLDFLHYQDVDRLLTISKTTRTNTLANVRLVEDLVLYLNNTLIPNMQSDNKEDQLSKLGSPAVDYLNFLVSDIRLRQVRKSPKACRPKAKRWAARCIMLFDDEDYQEGWTKKKIHRRKFSPDVTTESWIYTKRSIQLKKWFLFHNETKYPASSYITTLEKTKRKAWLTLKYLSDKKWFDYLTTVVFVDFALYNPYMKYLSLVTLMAERAQQGSYYIYKHVGIIKMTSTESVGELVVLIFLFAVFMCLILYINKESKKYSLVKPKQLFSKNWTCLKKTVLLLGVINVIIFIYKTLRMDYYYKTIGKFQAMEFIDSGNLELLDLLLRVLIAFMLFLIILEVFQVFGMFYRAKLFLTTISRSQELIYCFIVLLLILLLAFSWAGYVLFLGNSYNFHKIHYAFYTVFGYTNKNFDTDRFGNLNQIYCLTFLYCFLFLITFFFVIRWLMAAIMIHSYYAVTSYAHEGFNQPLLSDYIKKYFNTVDSSPNRKPMKRERYLRKMELKLRIIGFLVVDLYEQYAEPETYDETNKVRELAMAAISLDVLRECYQRPQTDDTDSGQYHRKEQAKALTRNIINIATLNSKLDYLSAKLDIMIREERYRKIKSLSQKEI